MWAARKRPDLFDRESRSSRCIRGCGEKVSGRRRLPEQKQLLE